MEHDGTVTVPAERETVWETVTDPEVLTACVMGAEEVRRVDDRTYEGVVRQSLAGLTVALDGQVEIENLDRPERLAFSGVGTDDRTNSRMEADAEVTLTADADETTLAYDVTVTFAGRLATLGARVLRRQVRTNVDTYFDNLVDHVGENA
jgi:carbon monoxide dehydrogenase subunit G